MGRLYKLNWCKTIAILSVCFLNLLNEEVKAQYSSVLPTKVHTIDREIGQSGDHTISIKSILNEIETERNVSFIYDSHLLENRTVGQLGLGDENYTQKLPELLASVGLTYSQLTDGAYVIVPVEEQEMIAQEAQPERITGRVVDESDNEPLIGVNIIAKGADTGTSTNVNGEFIIEVENMNDTLAFSYIGYIPKEVPIEGRTEIDVEMELQVVEGEEFVVIGYGIRRAETLTGAVDQISREDLQNRVMPNLTQGLQGVIPNVNIDPMDGRPIENPEINIRGMTSIGMGGSALVLIDGVEGDPSMLNPSDIESISVLKDAASAAMYGARGAFGVVLITTTRQDEPGTTLNFETRMGVQRPTVHQDLETEPLTWARMFKESYENWHGNSPSSINKTMPFSDSYLEELERRVNNPDLPRVDVSPSGEYWYFADTNWYDELYTDNRWTAEYNLRLSTGTETTSLTVSGRYLDQDGLFRYNPDDYRMLNLRADGTIIINDWIQFNNNFSVSDRTYFSPVNVGEGSGIWRNIADEGHPLAPMFNPDGTLTHPAAFTVGDHWYGRNGLTNERTVFRNKSEVVANFFDERITLTGDFSFQNTYSDEVRRRVQVPYSRWPDQIDYIGTQYNDLRETSDKQVYLASNLYGEFQQTFADRHNFRTTLGINYEESTFERLRGERNGLLLEDAKDLNLALGESILTTGGFEKWQILGSFARLNYIYDDRYMLEFSGRYDGSSKFPESERYAFFPSVSAGWRISEESFWNIPDNIISELRLRASYGSMGNGNISAYQFHQTFGITTTSRIIGDTQPRATSSPEAMPSGLTWETSTTRNLGIDFGMFSDRLQFTGDAYVRKTTDMYTRGLSLPRTFGTGSPFGNYADLETTGWEASISWRDMQELGGRYMSYGIRVNVSDNWAEIKSFNNPDKLLTDYYEGMRVGEIWGYVTDGFFESEEDVLNHADQSRFRSNDGGGHGPGDIKFKDLNGNGRIGPGDNTVNNPGDQKVIGNESPRYRFGINFDISYGNFFTSAFFQGVGKRDFYPSREASYFWGQYNRPYNDIPAWHMEDGMIWSEENPDAYFPKYTSRLAHEPNATLLQTQTRYLQNGAYIRLKNFQFGYHLPSSILSSFGMQAARIYVTGENLWTYTPFYDKVGNVDIENIVMPENRHEGPSRRGHGYNYPVMRSLTLGFSVTF